MEGVGAPGLILPDASIVDHGGHVATPGCPIPAEALANKGGTAFKRCGQAGFGGVLNLDFPSVVDEPASQAIVVVGLGERDAEEPFLVREVGLECFILEDGCADSGRSARETCDPTIDMGRRGHPEVPALKVCSAEEVPDIQLCGAFQGSKGSHGANRNVLERGEKMGEEGLWPEDIIVGEDNNRSLDVLNTLDHLQTLVRFGGGEDVEMMETQVLADGLNGIWFGSHDDDRFWMASTN